MNASMYFVQLFCAAALVTALGTCSPALAQGTAFMYQGLLQESGLPAEGTYAMRFSLHSTETGPSPLGPVLTNTPVLVINGLFETVLDFGPGVFTGSPRWLEMALRPEGSIDPFTVMVPRQELMPTPYAIYAVDAASAGSIPASGITGTIPDAKLPDHLARLDEDVVFSGSVSASVFSGDGMHLFGVPSDRLSGPLQTTYTLEGAGHFPVNAQFGVMAVDVAVDGSHAYAVYGAQGLDVFDVSLPDLPVRVGHISTISQFHYLEAVPPYLLVGYQGVSRIDVIDVQVPTNPVAVTSIGQAIRDMQAVGDTLYVAGGHSGLYLYDISVVTNPVLLAATNNTGFTASASGVGVAGSRAYVAQGTQGVMIYDVDDPAEPEHIGSITGIGTAWKAAAVPGYAFIVSHDGWRVMDVSDPGTPMMVFYQSNSVGNADCDIHVDGDYLYVSLLQHGLFVFDIYVPTNPVLKAAYDDGGENGFAVGVDVDGSLAVLANSGDGVRIYRSDFLTSSGSFSGDGSRLSNVTHLAEAVITAAHVVDDQLVRSINGMRDNISLAPGTGTLLHTNDSALVLSIDPDIAWNTTGNTGVVEGVHFLGSINNKPLELRANNRRALLLSVPSSGGSPNILGGFEQNTILSNLWGQPILGSTIAGGGRSLAGQVNRVDANYSFLGSGYGNRINILSHNSLIGAGSKLMIESNAPFSVIMGGEESRVGPGANHAVIGGGYRNLVGSNTSFGVIAGGVGNMIDPHAVHSVIAGGANNRISAYASNSIIAGGWANTIHSNATDAVIPGGSYNNAGGRGSMAAGTDAEAMHEGTFVWSDARFGGMTSTASNQFLIRAGGGVGINRNDPQYDLDVDGTVRAHYFIGNGRDITGTTPAFDSITTEMLRSYVVTSDKLALDEDSLWFVSGGLMWGNTNSLHVEVAGSVHVRSNLSAQSFSGYGAGLNSVDALSLQGKYASSFWQRTGNSGTTAGTDYLGTSDDEPLELHVNARRALRLEPAGNGAQPNVIAGSAGNRVLSSPTAGVQGASIGGGDMNEVKLGGILATIGGGYSNWVAGLGGTLGGGLVNRIDGGEAPVIGGGKYNRIFSAADGAVIGGGMSNVIHNAAHYGTVPGGAHNEVQGRYGLAAGYRAHAMHPGVFVWADNENADFQSTLPNQFLIRAAGGVGINTNRPSRTLDVNGGILGDSLEIRQEAAVGSLSATGQVMATRLVVSGNAMAGSLAVSGIATAHTFTGSFIGDGSGLSGLSAGSTLSASDGTPSAAVYVDNSGQVGIGTVTPVSKLAVSGTVTALAFSGDGSGLTHISSLGSPDGNLIESVNVNNIGTVGILTGADPSYALKVSGPVRMTQLYVDALQADTIEGYGDAIYGLSHLDAPDGDPENVVKVDHAGRVAIAQEPHSNYILRVGGPVKVEGSLEAISITSSDFIGYGPNLQGISSLDAPDLSPQRALLVDLEGDVGINNTNPQQRLHITGSAQLDKEGAELGRLILRTTTRNDPGRYGIQFENNTLGLFLGDDSQAQTFGFYSAWGSARSNDAMVRVHGKANGSWGNYVEITHDGKNGHIRTDLGSLVLSPYARVGIGRTPASNKLEVEGDASKTVAGSWLANSDARIKTDIKPIVGALATLNDVNPITFRYTPSYRALHPSIEDRPYVNVIAQEFREIFPDYVRSSGETLENGESILQVDTYPITMYTVAAVKELNAAIQARDAVIQELLQRVSALEARLGSEESDER